MAAPDAPTLDLAPADLGTLELDDDLWVTYVDLHGELPYLPTRVRVGADVYVFVTSYIIHGHGATMPAHVRDLRAAGKKVIVIQRGSSGSGGKNERYLVFAS